MPKSSFSQITLKVAEISMPAKKFCIIFFHGFCWTAFTKFLVIRDGQPPDVLIMGICSPIL